MFRLFLFEVKARSIAQTMKHSITGEDTGIRNTSILGIRYYSLPFLRVRDRGGMYEAYLGHSSCAVPLKMRIWFALIRQIFFYIVILVTVTLCNVSA